MGARDGPRRQARARAHAGTEGPDAEARSPRGSVRCDGAGGIYSSVRDMAKYVAFQLAAYPPRNEADRGRIQRATFARRTPTGVPAGFKYEPPAVAMSYGFGWASSRRASSTISSAHNGAIDSYRADIRFSPSRGVGIVALTNFGEGNPARSPSAR